MVGVGEKKTPTVAHSIYLRGRVLCEASEENGKTLRGSKIELTSPHISIYISRHSVLVFPLL